MLVSVVQHQVHSVEGAGADAEDGEAAATCAGTEKNEEWVRQASWSGTARGRRQVLEDGQEDAPEVARAEQAGVAGKTHAMREKAATESCEKRQMLWKSMTDRSWTELVQQWDVPAVDSLQLQKSIGSLMRDRPSAGGLALQAVDMVGEAE